MYILDFKHNSVDKTTNIISGAKTTPDCNFACKVSSPC